MTLKMSRDEQLLKPTAERPRCLQSEPTGRIKTGNQHIKFIWNIWKETWADLEASSSDG